MKLCVNCQAELPDSAHHCVYCGSKQPEVPGGGPDKRTMMGHPGMAEELARQASTSSPPGPNRSSSHPADGFAATEMVPRDALPPQPGQSHPHGMPPQQGYGGPPPGGPGGPPPGYGGPPPGGPGGPPPGYGGPPPGGPGGPPPGYGGPPPGGPGGPPPGYGGPPPGYGGPPPGGPGGPPPGYGGPPPGYGGPPPGYGGPPPGGPGGPPPGHGGPPPGYGGPPPGGPGFTGPPGSGPQPYGGPAHAHERPPYLASETSHRMQSPSEPWAQSLKTLMMVFGVLLIACFVAPWGVIGGKATFSWTTLQAEVPIAFKLRPLLLAGTGFLAVVLGALPLGTQGRGLAAAGVGLAPVLFLALSADPFVWQAAVLVVSMVCLVSGLILRSEYTGAMPPRILATVGAVGVIALYLIPENGTVPIAGLFEMLGAADGKGKLLIIVGISESGLTVGLLPLLLAACGFLVWLPPSTNAGALIVAWANIVWGMVVALCALAIHEAPVEYLKASLSGVLYFPLAGAAWLAMAGYGIATVAGKQLESS